MIDDRPEPPRPLVIYHGNCYDGFGAAWAAWRLLGDRAEYRPAFYGQPPPDDWWCRSCYVLDFSYPAKVIQKRIDDDPTLRNGTTEFMVLDHHKTAQADLAKVTDCCLFDMNKSGAMLAWEFFHGRISSPPALVNYVQDRDLWKFELPGSREVSAWLQSFEMKFAEWNQLAQLLETSLAQVIAQGKAILRAKDQMVRVMAGQSWMEEIGEYWVPVANATVYFSEVGEELCKRHPEALFAAYFLDRADGKRQWGLRSRGGFDVSEVAKKFGGGGHPAAAGFTTARGEMPQWINRKHTQE